MSSINLIDIVKNTVEEQRRLERVAVGRICGCKSCLCCEELARDTAAKQSVKSKGESV